MADKILKSLNFGGADNYFPLPLVTAADNDKILSVVNGEWTAVDAPASGGGSGQYVWKKSKLVPLEGYTELEYIQTNGSQYINTGVFPTYDTTLEMKLQTTQSASACLASGCVSWANKGFGIYTNGVMYGNQTRDESVANFHGSSPVVAMLDRNKLYKDGVLLWTANDELFTSPVQMTLFGMNANGTVSEKTVMKHYYTKIYERGIAIRRYKACKNDSGVVGLYDLVSDEFSTKATGNDFTAGTAIGTLNRHEFESYVVSANIGAYPLEGELDGYFYELIKVDNLASVAGLTEEYYNVIQSTVIETIAREVNT